MNNYGIQTGESYAGTYRLINTGINGWRILLKNGREVGAWCGRGGVYAAANYFKV